MEKPRRTFCSDVCVHEWKIRTSPGYARAQVEARDHCICSECGIDTEEARLFARRVRHRLLELHARQVRPFADGDCLARLEAIRIPGWPADLTRSAWAMDHIVPVSEGGGSAGLDNLQSICIWCHRDKTTAHAKRRAEARRQSLSK